MDKRDLIKSEKYVATPNRISDLMTFFNLKLLVDNNDLDKEEVLFIIGNSSKNNSISQAQYEELMQNIN